jgi:hypothetical protein
MRCKAVHGEVAKPPAEELPRVQSLDAAQFVGEKIPSPRLLWGIQPTVQSNQGGVDCGLAQATVCCPGCATGFGGFLDRETKFPSSYIECRGGGLTPTDRVFFYYILFDTSGP